LSIDELVDRTILLDKIEKGIKDADRGKVIKEEDLIIKLNHLFY